MAPARSVEFHGSPWWPKGVALGACAVAAVIVVDYGTWCFEHITSDLHTLSHLNVTIHSSQYPLFKKRRRRLNNLPMTTEVSAVTCESLL